MIGPRRALLLFILLLGLVACSSAVPPNPALPTVNCQIAEGCGAVLDAAAKVVSLEAAQITVFYGRGLAFHAEVHVCYPGGGYVLIDVIGDPPKAGIRAVPWPSPPCR
jgi:hypothetical protein